MSAPPCWRRQNRKHLAAVAKRSRVPKLPERLSAVTAGDAEAVAKKYLRPEQMILICVGDRVKIEPELKKLDLGAIEIRDADGKIIP